MALPFRSRGTASPFIRGVWSYFTTQLNLITRGAPPCAEVPLAVWNDWVTGSYAPMTTSWCAWCDALNADFRDLLKIISVYQCPSEVSKSPRFKSKEAHMRRELLHAFAGDCKVDAFSLRTIIAKSKDVKFLTYQPADVAPTSPVSMYDTYRLPKGNYHDSGQKRTLLSTIRLKLWCALLDDKKISPYERYPDELCKHPVKGVDHDQWEVCLRGLAAPAVSVVGTYGMNLGLSYPELWSVYSLFAVAATPEAVVGKFKFTRQDETNLHFRFKSSWPHSVCAAIFTPEEAKSVRLRGTLKRVETRKERAVASAKILEEKLLAAACEGRGGDVARLRLDLEHCDTYGLTGLQEKRRVEYEAEQKAKREVELKTIELNKAQLAEVLTAPKPRRIKPEVDEDVESWPLPPPPPPLPPPPPPPLPPPPLPVSAPKAEYEPTSEEAQRIRLQRMQEAERTARKVGLFYNDVESVLSPEEQKKFPRPKPRPVPATPFVPKKFYDTLNL